MGSQRVGHDWVTFTSLHLSWSDVTRCHDLYFLNAEFWANFFTLLFHFHQKAVSSSSLSAIRVVSSAYLRLLIFLTTILIPACYSSSLAFRMMYLAQKLCIHNFWTFSGILWTFSGIAFCNTHYCKDIINIFSVISMKVPTDGCLIF